MDRSVLINKGMSSRKKSLIFSVLTFMVVVVGVLSATYAYFTASADQQNSYTFASMSLTLKTASGDVFDSDEFSATYNQKLTPGDSVNFSDIKVKNESSVDVYSLIKLVVEITKSSSTEPDLTIKKWYNLSGQEVEQDDSGEIYLVNTSTKADATAITTNTSEATNITYTFPTNLDTTYTNATAEFTLTACAVQKDNLQTSQTRTASNFACYYICNEFGTPSLTIYLDGTASTIKSDASTIADLDANTVTGATTCGWFYDEDCTDPAPLDATLSGVPLYTKTATMNMVTTTTNSTGLTVTGSTTTTPTGEIVIPQQIDGVQVTEIGANAFKSKTGITNVVIPEGVAKINQDAFYGCTGITSVTIPSTVTYVAGRSFYNNTKLTSVKIYSEEIDIISNRSSTSSTYEYGGSFRNCSKLVYNEYGDIYYLGNENNPYVVAMQPKSYSTIVTATLHQDCKSIAQSCFYKATALTTVNLNEGLLRIGDRAFENCSNLTTVSAIPSSVTKIGDYAFYNCTKLTGVTISNDTTQNTLNTSNILNNNNTHIKALSTDDTTSNIFVIGDYAFYGCTGLTSIDIQRTKLSVGKYAFSMGDGTPSNVVANPATITINGELVDANEGAFNKCRRLTGNITLSDDVTTIGNYAFCGCQLLTNIVLNEGLTTIGSYAFSGCVKIATITLPSSITAINTSAFNMCYNLFEVCNLSDLTLTKGSSNNGYVAYWAKDVYTTTDYTSKIIISNDCKYYVDGTTKICIGTENRNTNLTIDNDCTEINKYAFSYCTELKNITIPTSIKTIGLCSFYYCTGLISVEIPNSITVINESTFYGCSSLSSISIPSTITSIENYAFRYCTSLTGITIPNSVKGLGIGSFEDCTGLLNITIPSSVTSWGERVFASCTSLQSVTLPVGTTHVGKYAFAGCNDCIFTIIDGIKYLQVGDNPLYLAYGLVSGTTSYTIHEDAKHINSYFGGSSSTLTAITIPSNITFGAYAFYKCTSLTNVTLNEGLASIGSQAFYGCSGLTNITIPSSVTSIGSQAFYGCSGLTSVTLNEGLTSLGTNAFYGCTGLTSITIPSSVTSIGNYCFKNCTGLTSVMIDEGLSSIGGFAFDGCTNIASITIPRTVTKIGGYVFRGCTNISSIILPSSITSMANNVFDSWTSSQTINCVATRKPSSGWNSGWNTNCSATIVWGYTGE